MDWEGIAHCKDDNEVVKEGLNENVLGSAKLTFQQFSTSFYLTLTACNSSMTNPLQNVKPLANISYNDERFLPSRVKSGTILSWCNKFLKKMYFFKYFDEFWYDFDSMWFKNGKSHSGFGNIDKHFIQL